MTISEISIEKIMTKLPIPSLTPHHVGISVENLETSITFWSQILGFKVEFRKHIEPIQTNLAFLKRDNFRIELFEKNGSLPTPEYSLKPNTDLDVNGTKHLCFSVENVQCELERLFTQNVEIVGVMRGLQSAMYFEKNPLLDAEKNRVAATAFFFLAPSNILIEIVGVNDFINC